jgi:hypothetical protein
MASAISSASKSLVTLVTSISFGRRDTTAVKKVCGRSFDHAGDHGLAVALVRLDQVA